MNPSLEDQRRALLAQIEASRAVYRRMLAGGSVAGPAPAAGNRLTLHSGMVSGRRPQRSAAVQWAMDHPLPVAGAVALLVLLLPRAAAARRSRAQARQRPVPAPGMQGVGRALLTTAVLLLRDPARLQAASRLASAGWRWLRQSRSRRPALPATARISDRHLSKEES